MHKHFFREFWWLALVPPESPHDELSILSCVQDHRLGTMAVYNIAPSKATFVSLTVTSAIMLFGFLSINGGFLELFTSMFTHRFSNGKPLYPTYTGVAAVDFVLRMPVSFWTPAMTQNPSLKLQSVVLYPALQALAAGATVESFRRGGDKPLMLRWSPLFIFVWMWAGSALFYPMFCYFDLVRHYYNRNQGGTGQGVEVEVPYYQAVSIPIATFISYFWPYIMIHFPPATITSAQHQNIIALNQFGSFLCYVLVAAGATYLSTPNYAKTTTKTTPRPRNSDAPWLKATYAFFGLFSAVVHLAVLGRLLFRPGSLNGDDVSLAGVFVPRLADGLGAGNFLSTPQARAVMMAPQVQFFMQWDYLLVLATAAVWSARNAEAMCCRRAGGWPPLTGAAVVLALGLASFLLNPGTVLSAVLYLREDFLRKQVEEKGSGPRENGEEFSDEKTAPN